MTYGQTHMQEGGADGPHGEMFLQQNFRRYYSTHLCAVVWWVMTAARLLGTEELPGRKWQAVEPSAKCASNPHLFRVLQVPGMEEIHRHS